MDRRRINKQILSMLLAFAVVFTFSFAVFGTDSYAASKSKKYSLPKEIRIVYYGIDGYQSETNVKYDKYGNLTYTLDAEMIPVTYKIKYRNKKGAISSLTYGDGDDTAQKYYDKKGRLKKIVKNGKTYTYKTNKKGIIKKVSVNGKKYYSVKSIKYHKNGFVSKVVYSNGNVNKYNSKGLMTYAKEKKTGTKYTYKYTKKKGKVVKVIVKRNGKNYKKITVKYGKTKTNDIWKYSSFFAFAGGPSNANELYAKSSLSGENWFN